MKYHQLKKQLEVERNECSRLRKQLERYTKLEGTAIVARVEQSVDEQMVRLANHDLVGYTADMMRHQLEDYCRLSPGTLKNVQPRIRVDLPTMRYRLSMSVVPMNFDKD